MDVQKDEALETISKDWTRQCEESDELLPLPQALIERLDQMQEQLPRNEEEYQREWQGLPSNHPAGTATDSP